MHGLLVLVGCSICLDVGFGKGGEMYNLRGYSLEL